MIAENEEVGQSANLLYDYVMRTPAGKQCKHYYEDFNRGRAVQECRLLRLNPDSERWEESDCGQCPVPDILAANGDPNLVLQMDKTKGFLGFNRKLVVTASCSKHFCDVDDPYIGCNQCAGDRPSSIEDLFKGK